MKLTRKNLSTEHRILKAARKVFQQKGMHGARMQDIADSAGINKALLHYYFRNKERLFEAVFKEAMEKFLPVLRELVESDVPPEQKIRSFVNGYMDVLLANPFLPAFIIHEMNQDAGRIEKLFFEKGVAANARRFFRNIEAASAAGKMKVVDPRQLLINMVSLCVFPFAAKPIIIKIMGMSEPEFQKFIGQRKEIITKLILQSIKN
jgi:TetR/AcrR family transcriptional regulator